MYNMHTFQLTILFTVVGLLLIYTYVRNDFQMVVLHEAVSFHHFFLSLAVTIVGTTPRRSCGYLDTTSCYRVFISLLLTPNLSHNYVNTTYYYSTLPYVFFWLAKYDLANAQHAASTQPSLSGEQTTYPY